MRQLHVVALSEDGRFLLLAPGKDATKGTFRVPLDARLTAAVRGELPRPGQTAAPASDLTPKQIQARLRAGETAEQIARSAGVPVARVERFAGPVEGEMARIIDAARAAVLTRARRGASAVSLGDAVSAHLVEADVDPAEVVWTARRAEDGAWLVEASFTSRGRKKRSTWRYEPATRDLTAADASSAVLGYVEPPDSRPAAKVVAAVAAGSRRTTSARRRTPAARRSPAAAKVPPAAKAPATSPAGGVRKPAGAVPAKASAAVPAKAVAPAATARTVTAAKGSGTRTARPPAARAPATTPAKAPAKTAAKAPAKAPAKTAAKTAAKAPKTAAKAPARQPGRTAPKGTAAAPAPAADRSRTRTPAVPPSAASRPARQRRTVAAVEPPAPSGPPQLRVVPAPDDEPRTRASVPAWADVLLSTTPPSRPDSTDRDGD